MQLTKEEKDKIIEEGLIVYMEEPRKHHSFNDVAKAFENVIANAEQMCEKNRQILIEAEIDRLLQKQAKEIFDEIDKAIPRGISPYYDRKEKIKSKFIKEVK